MIGVESHDHGGHENTSRARRGLAYVRLLVAAVDMVIQHEPFDWRESWMGLCEDFWCARQVIKYIHQVQVPTGESK